MNTLLEKLRQLQSEWKKGTQCTGYCNDHERCRAKDDAYEMAAEEVGALLDEYEVRR